MILTATPSPRLIKIWMLSRAKLRKPFADYVFFYILRDAGRDIHHYGVGKTQGGANQYVEPIVRQVSTWNRMANSLNLFAEWVDNGSAPCRDFH